MSELDVPLKLKTDRTTPARGSGGPNDLPSRKSSSEDMRQSLIALLSLVACAVSADMASRAPSPSAKTMAALLFTGWLALSVHAFMHHMRRGQAR